MFGPFSSYIFGSHGGGSSYSALVDPGGGLLCASILDLVGSLGSTKGLVSLCFPCLLSLPIFALFPQVASFAFRRKLGDAVAVRETVKPSWSDIFKGTRPFVGPLASPSMVACNLTLGLLRNLRFRNPDDFQAGSLHTQPPIWEKLLSNVSLEHVDLMDAIKEGVNNF